MEKTPLGWVYAAGDASAGAGVGAKITAPPLQAANNMTIRIAEKRVKNDAIMGGIVARFWGINPSPAALACPIFTAEGAA